MGISFMVVHTLDSRWIQNIFYSFIIYGFGESTTPTNRKHNRNDHHSMGQQDHTNIQLTIKAQKGGIYFFFSEKRERKSQRKKISIKTAYIQK